MWGMVLGGAILGVLVLLALVRPLRFRVAMGYAWAARKAMIPVVLGLSTITAVLGAAAIIEDSAIQGVRESFVSPFHVVDGYMGTWSEAGIDEAALEAFLERDDMEPILDVTPLRTGSFAAEGPTGLGDTRGDFWVVDPEDYAAFVDFRSISGELPTRWGPTDAVLDERGAVMYGVTAGDEVTAFVGSRPVPFLDQVEVDGTYNTTAVPSLGGTTGNTTDDGRRELASFEVRQRDWVHISIMEDDAGAAVDPDQQHLQLWVDWPGGSGSVALNTEENPTHDYWIFGDDEAGTWTISIEPNGPTGSSGQPSAATDVSYSGTIGHEGERIPDAREVTLQVAAVVDDAGTPLQDRGTVLVGPAAAEGLFDSTPPVRSVFMDLRDDIDHKRFQATLEQAVDEHFGGRIYAQDVQYQVESLTDDIEKAVGPTFVAFGSLSIGAGLVLVVVLVNLIVEERRRVLGTLRAVGGTRGQVQLMVLHELAIVALVSILVGTAFAALLAGGVQGLIQALLENDSESLAYVIKASAVFDSAGWAFTLILGAAWFGARRALKASPNELLRDHPDPPTKRAWVGRLVAIILSATVALPLLVWAPPAFAWLIAGSAVVVSTAWALSRFTRIPFILDIALIGLFIAIVIAMGSHDLGDEESVEILLFPIEGLFLVAIGSTLLVRSRLVHAALVTVLSGPLRSMGEMATGNLRDRPGRQTAILAVLATSILMITAMSLMFQTLGPDTADDDGGFPVVGSTHVGLGDAATYFQDNPPKSGADPFAVSDVVLTVPSAYDWGSFGIRHDDGEGNSWVWGGYMRGAFDLGLELTDQLAAAFVFDDVEYAPGVDGWDDAVTRVQQDPHAVILSGQTEFYESTGEFGDYHPASFDLPLVDEETGEPMQVVAIVPGAGNFAVLMGPERFDAVHEDYDPTLVLFRPADGVTSAELATEAAAAFRSAGMDVTDMNEEFREERRVEITIQTILGLFLGLGILVGMLSLALIAQRTYRQRQGSLAILRAIGASKERVMVGFVVEQVLVVVLAVALGVVVGLLMAGSMLLAVDSDIELRVNAVFITGILGATLLGGTLVGLLPALKIRRMRLAEALRYE